MHTAIQPYSNKSAFQSVNSYHQPEKAKLIAYFSQCPIEIRRAQELRTRVFNLNLSGINLDKDDYDDICLHLVVKDTLSNNVVGYSRLLTSDLTSSPSNFYTASEFNIESIIEADKRYLEVGRTCVDPSYRSGAVIAMIWSKIGQFMIEHHIDYLIGCASLSMLDGGRTASAIVNHLKQNNFTKKSQRVTPKVPLSEDVEIKDGEKHIPSLLKTYLRMGAKVCGEAHIDYDFNVADIVVLLARKDIKPRYLRHFS